MAMQSFGLYDYVIIYLFCEVDTPNLNADAMYQGAS